MNLMQQLINNIFSKKRILEIDGKFIPQIRNSSFDDWYSKDTNYNYTWFFEYGQLKYCSYNTLEEAKAAIKSMVQIRKIHKI